MSYMREVGIVGVGCTKFGKSEASYLDLLTEAALLCFADAGLTPEQCGVDEVLVSSMGAGMNGGIAGSASALVDALNLTPAAAERVENGPASGASAVKLATMAIKSGLCDCVLVVGGEKMTGRGGKAATEFVSTMLHPEEYKYGLTLSSFAAMLTRSLMEKYGLTSEDLARIAVKNHRNGLLNPNAQLHKEVTLEQLTTGKDKDQFNPLVADPLRRYDICPMSDGAAALLLVGLDKANKFKKKPIRIAGIGQATDTHVVANRKDVTDLKAVRLAAEKAYKAANLTPQDIDVAELHDAFEILEIVESEEVGFFKKGEGHLAVRRNETSLTGKMPINPSGGLKAKGHPLGATGVSQLVELVYQLRNEAGARQVKGARNGLAVNFGGFGNNVIVTILTNK